MSDHGQRLLAIARQTGRLRTVPGASKSFGLILPLVEDKVREAFEDPPYHLRDIIEPFFGMRPIVVAARVLASVLDGGIRQTRELHLAYSIGKDLYEERMYRTLESEQGLLWRKAKGLTLKSDTKDKRANWQRFLSEQGLYELPDKAVLRETGRVWLELVMVWTGLVQRVRRRKAQNKWETWVRLCEEFDQHLDDLADGVDQVVARRLPLLEPAKEDAPYPDWKEVRGRGDSKPSEVARVAAIRLGNVAWQINKQVLDVAVSMQDKDVPGLPISPAAMAAKLKDQPLSTRRKIKDYMASHRGQYVQANRMVRQARDWSKADTLYFPHNFDRRGRMYPATYGLSPQSSDLGKGLLQFAQSCHIEVDGPGYRDFVEYGAALRGVKGSHDERYQRGLSFLSEAQEVMRDPVRCDSWTTASDPWQYLAWCFEAGRLYRDRALTSHLPVQFDGTANGLQMYALLMQDEQLGRMVNLVDPSQYSDIYSEVSSMLLDQAVQGYDEDLREWASYFGSIPREAVKSAVLAAVFNQSKYGQREFFTEYLVREASKRPRRPRKGIRRMSWAMHSAMNSVFYDAEWADSFIRCRSFFADLGRSLADAGVTPRWTSPSGFQVHTPYERHTGHRTIRMLTDSSVIRRSDGEWVPDKSRISRAMAPNVIQSVEASVMHFWVSDLPDVASCGCRHDGFLTLATDVATGKRVLRGSLQRVPWHDYLDHLHDSVVELTKSRNIPGVPDRGSLDLRRAIHNPYSYW
jgi:DNA-directed RNA polymerase